LGVYALGQAGGTEHVALTVTQLPAHSHSLNVHPGKADQKTAVGSHLANGSVYTNQLATGTAANDAIGTSGLGEAHENRQPYLTLNWIIALFGEFPVRS
jgi:microcystin-dependent protein